MKKFVIVVYSILVIIALKLILDIIVNSIFINQYNNEKYSTKLASIQTVINFPESYIALYNYGNVLYKNENYFGAIELYERALNGYVPKKKECSIRINYALAKCKLVQVDENNQESILQAIQTYEEAISILVEKDCAKYDGSGHSKDAEKLKDDIQKEIERLKKLLDTSYEQPNEDNEEEKKQNNSKEDTIEKKLQQIKEEAIKKQKDQEEIFKERDYSTDLYTKKW